MGPRGTFRAIEADMRREAREAQRRQRELERRAKEQAKLSAHEQAKLEVETYENQLEVLLSMHKEQGRTWDWLAVLTSVPPVPARRSSFHELQAKQRAVVLRPDRRQSAEPEIKRARARDDEELTQASNSYATELAEWEKLRALARRLLAGEHRAYIEVLTELSALREIRDLGSEVHFTVHDSNLIECVVTVNGEQAIPTEIKILTSTGKLSVKSMPRSRFQEIYADYLCGCVFRAARDVFAVLPVQTLLITACADTLDTKTGKQAQKPVLSVIIPRAALDDLNFDRLDPSDAMENFLYRGRLKGTRKSDPFEEVAALTLIDVPHQSVKIMSVSDLIAKAQRDADAFNSEATKLKRQPMMNIPELKEVL
jgi:hypothetical protein